jgi:DNA topoisomerase-1
MAKNLVIVESPTKAGTIEKYLGKDFQVLASGGHVRDLPASKMGVDLENNFQPTYIIPIKARKTINNLKKALKDKQTVYLATDLDREGEAIAWHIQEALDLGRLKGVEVKRITFDEITKNAILTAVQNPREIDQQLVDAQQARRILDRLVGYTLSPILWKKIYKGLSAGRVQSVALRLIVDRERERQAFAPVEYWSLKAVLQKSQSQKDFTANLVVWQNQKIEPMGLKTEDQVNQIIQSLAVVQYQIRKIESKNVKRYAPPPYTTSSMQQDAVNKLGYSSKRTMQLAQQLYEEGLITYMRTDSVSLAEAALGAIRTQISSKYGANYLPAKAIYYKNKNKNAQEAHEAIRPSDFSKLPENLSLDSQAKKLYLLIYNRALASQMKEAEFKQVAVDIVALAKDRQETAIFRATGQEMLFPGFLAAMGKEDKEDNLPELKEGEQLVWQSFQSEQHFTEPPPRYSEATLIKYLEEQGIGRPSTYAPTIDTLMQRQYVRTEQRRLIPEEAGYLVTDLLAKYFPEIVDTNFTAEMEDRLDLVATGQQGYTKVLSEFWQPFAKKVEEESDKIEKLNLEETTDKICPNCGAPMVIKRGRFGKFLACSRFPDCKTTLPLKQTDPTGLICPVCGKELLEKRARRSTFFGCSGYPDCDFAIWKKEYLPAKITALEKEGKSLFFKEPSLLAFQALGIEAATSLPVPRKVRTKKTKVASKKVKR